MRLSESSLTRLAAQVERPGYDRAQQRVGIVHFGIGAFHRAHQAWYTDRAMEAGDRDWAITGVSLRSPTVAEQLNPQDGLYTVSERSAGADKVRLVGAVRDVLVAPIEREAVIAAIAAPTTRIVSLTITEKGYCRAADGNLDDQQAGGESFYAYLLSALRRRNDAGLTGLTLMSCDNLAENGRQLARLVSQYVDRHDPALLNWVEHECTFPSTMVDRIVPATTAADRAELAGRLGLDDAGAVMTEPFSQWVIEDRFAGARPDWGSVGAELVSDVAPYEMAKLRMLNGAHSLLAYCGLGRGHEFVHQAIADPQLRGLVEQLMLREAAPTIAAAPGQDLAGYAQNLIARFANPALNHRLIQIAMDGSQKVPQRWLETLATQQARGGDCRAIRAGLAAWISHLRGRNGLVEDPRAAELASVAGGSDPVDALFGPGGLLISTWEPTPLDRAAILSLLV